MKVVVAGDFCPRARGQKLVESGNFSNKFEGIQELTKKSDYSIVNFETNISTPKSIAIDKNGPSLTTTEDSLNLIDYLGFNVVTLANNHFYDYGADAAENTLKCLDRRNIKHVGGGNNIEEARKTLFLSKSGETLAIINACEHEFSIASNETGGSYGIDPIQIYYDIQAAKKKANYILVITHGGHEYHQLPSIRMQEWYRFFIDAGADAVINHHQHCFSGREVYKNKPIYYGLGNFFFDKKNQKEKTSWNEGLLVELTFSEGNIFHTAIPLVQSIEDASVTILEDRTPIDAKILELDKTIMDKKALIHKNQEFYSNGKRGLLSCFQPYCGRVFGYLYRKKILPSILPKRKLLSILNLVECESHHEKLKYVIKESIK